MHPITFWAAFGACYLSSISAFADGTREGPLPAPARTEAEPSSDFASAFDSVDDAWEALAREDSDGSEQSLSVDDFSVPDEASFEGLWDEAAHPDLYFTSPGCTLDISGGRRDDERGSSWFVGAFVSFPLGGPCNPLSNPIGKSALSSAERPRLVAQPLGLASVPTKGGSEGFSSSPRLAAEPSASPGSQKQAEVAPVPSAPPASRAKTSLESPAFLAEFAQRLRARGGASPLLERLDRLGRQERSSGLLPEVRLRGAYGLDQSLALESIGSVGGEATTRDGSDSVFEARLTFHLDRLAAPQNSTSLERLRHAVLRQEQEQLVNGFELLSDLIEAEALSVVEELSELERVKYAAKAQGLRMQIHLLTGGWFPLAANGAPPKKSHPVSATLAPAPDSPSP